MTRLTAFLSELKHRRVFRVAAVYAGVAFVLITLIACSSANSQEINDELPVTIFFTRHGEVDASLPGIPLNEEGFQRANELAQVLQRVRLTKVYSSHTLRSRQTVEIAAEMNGLSVIPAPPLGSQVEGILVEDSSPSRIAVSALTDSLLKLPAGSVVLVGVNADNLFGILNGLGVPLSTPQQPCEVGQTCVPCLDYSCFPQDEYDNLWLLTLSGPSRTPVLHWLKY